MAESTIVEPEELETFLANHDDWRVSHLGEWVLIKGREVLGFYPTFSPAFEAGVALFGDEIFGLYDITPNPYVVVNTAWVTSPDS